MDIRRLLEDLQGFNRTWERKSDRALSAGIAEWTKGVWFGIQIAIGLIQKHVKTPDSEPVSPHATSRR
jgi:hypothetical protein